MKKYTRDNLLQESSGFYLVLVAFLALVLLGFCGLVIGLGYLSTGKHYLQNASNFAALAALEDYITNTDEQNFSERLSRATGRANLVLQSNKVIGMSSTVGTIKPPGQGGGEGGEIQFGLWYQENPYPGGTEDPCSDNYPCFVAADPFPVPGEGHPQINAVKVIAGNESTNPLVAPFTNIFGSDQFFITAESTAAIARRCGAFLIDVTRSTASATHVAATTWDPYAVVSPDPETNEPHTLTVPERVGFFAQRAGHLNNSEGNRLNCAVDTYSQDAQLHWCNMGMYVPDEEGNLEWNIDRRLGGMSGYFDPSESPPRHFQSDFDEHPWPDPADPDATVLVDSLFVSYDTYFGPQPVSTFFLSFNAALRLIQSQGSFGDLVRITGVTGKPEGRSSWPDPDHPSTPDASPLSEDLDYAIRLTNINNRGTRNVHGQTVHQKQSPNFVEMGWVPLHTTPGLDGFLNLYGVLDRAIDIISQECPVNSNKFIILASDFKNDCSTPLGSDDPTCTHAAGTEAIPDYTGPHIDGGYDHFVATRQQIVDLLIPKMQTRRIAFTAILAGDHVRPHFVNRLRPDCSDPLNHECYITLEDASAYGFGGYGSTQEFFQATSFDDEGNPLSDPPGTFVQEFPGYELQYLMNEHWAFSAANRQPNVVFGQALPMAAKMAQDTGGLICPLMDLAPPVFYTNGNPGENPITHPDNGPFYLDPSQRAPVGQAQLFYPEYVSKAEQAARCAQKTVGLHPYVLVTEKP